VEHPARRDVADRAAPALAGRPARGRAQRLTARPGVAGWAQVHGATLATAEERDALDAWRIHHASPALDMRIALETAAYVFRGEREDEAAIEQAFRWRRKTPKRERRAVGDRPSEAAAEAAAPQPTGARRLPTSKATSQRRAGGLTPSDARIKALLKSGRSTPLGQRRTGREYGLATGRSHPRGLPSRSFVRRAAPA
jgi:hypothetical protein